MYSYQFVNNKNTWMGVNQHETAYYQGNPKAPLPYTTNAQYYDPTFTSCTQDNCARTWGMRFVNSSNIYNYGSGGYMFFNDWSSDCLGTSAVPLELCQQSMNQFTNSTDIWLWGLATKGGENMISWDDTPIVPQAANKGTYLQAAILMEIAGKQ
jgi:glucan 1,3-beta-glucosidase